MCGPIVAADYQTIGANKVVIPHAFFKVLQEENGKIHTIGFVYDNVAGRRPMSTYAMTVDEVEELTGIDFFPSLPDKVEKRAEAEVDFTKWTVKWIFFQKTGCAIEKSLYICNVKSIKMSMKKRVDRLLQGLTTRFFYVFKAILHILAILFLAND